MNNSPFELFRRNLKPMMVFLTGLALFAFVVLPVMDTYMRRGAGNSGESVVARFGKTELTDARVNYFTRNHQSTVRFLVELAQETIARGGVPQTPGFQFDTQTNQVRAIGISQNPSTELTIDTFLLASQAQEAGFELDDGSLQVWLENFTAEMISDSDIDGMLMQSTQNQMGRPHLYEQLRNHLLAQVFRDRGFSGLYMGDGPFSGPLMTPQEQWANFLKLNKQAVVSTYGVLVSDYLDKTNTTPSEEAVQAMYEEGKNRDFSDQSPEPAFHRRYSAKFEYLVGDFRKFLDEEIGKLAEEDIRAEYEKRRVGGEFQLPETPASDALKNLLGTPGSVDPADPAVGGAESDEADAVGTPAESSETEAADDEPEPAQESTDAASPEAEAASEGDSEDGGDEQSAIQPKSAMRLVALRQEGDSGSEDDEPTEDQSQDKPDDSKPDEEPADDTSPQAEATDDSPAEEPSSEAADTPEETPTTDPESATDSEGATDPEGTDKPDAAEAEEEPKIESFEDVRQEIAEAMAGPAASQRMSAALSDVTSQMRLYFNKLAIHESNLSIGQGGAPPVKPVLMQLGEQLGLKYEIIGPYTAATISDEPIANSSEMGTQFGGPGPSFGVMMYGFDNGQTQLPAQPLYSPVRTSDGPAGKQYVSWKVEETEAYTPTLEEVRDEVVMAIRTEEAREIAKKAAEEIAKLALEAGDASLKDFVPEDKSDNFNEGLGPFSWMDSFGFQGATIGNVPQLDSVGEEFMKEVFSTDTGKVGVAMNQPGRVFYIVKVNSYEPNDEELQNRFKEPTNRMMAMLISNDAEPIVRDFYDKIDEETGFVNYLQQPQP